VRTTTGQNRHHDSEEYAEALTCEAINNTDSGHTTSSSSLSPFPFFRAELTDAVPRAFVLVPGVRVTADHPPTPNELGGDQHNRATCILGPSTSRCIPIDEFEKLRSHRELC